MSLENRIRLNGARILVKEKKLNSVTDKGIILPGREKQQTNMGTVLAVGDGAMLSDGTKVPVGVSVGETVVYSSFSGSPIKETEDDAETYLIINERDVLCVITS